MDKLALEKKYENDKEKQKKILGRHENRTIPIRIAMKRKQTSKFPRQNILQKFSFKHRMTKIVTP